MASAIAWSRTAPTRERRREAADRPSGLGRDAPRATADRAVDVVPGEADTGRCHRRGAAPHRLRPRAGRDRGRAHRRARFDAGQDRAVRARRGDHHRGPVRVRPRQQPDRSAQGSLTRGRARLGGRPLGPRGGRGRGRAGTPRGEPQPARGGAGATQRGAGPNPPRDRRDIAP